MAADSRRPLALFVLCKAYPVIDGVFRMPLGCFEMLLVSGTRSLGLVLVAVAGGQSCHPCYAGRLTKPEQAQALIKVPAKRKRKKHMESSGKAETGKEWARSRHTCARARRASFFSFFPGGQAEKQSTRLQPYLHHVQSRVVFDVDGCHVVHVGRGRLVFQEKREDKTGRKRRCRREERYGR